MMLRWSLGEVAAADALEAAVEAVLDAGLRTRDLGGDATTEQVAELATASVSGAVAA
jgi:3-isopropylmalate dehydrogenase